MTETIEKGKTTAVVPRDVYEFIQDVKKDDPDAMVSIQGMIMIARERKMKDVAKWLKDNPLAYGIGFWGEFEPADHEVKDDPNRPRERKKRKKRKLPEESNNDS